MVFGKGINDVINSRDTKEYQVWHSMIRRCYSDVYQKLKPTYVGTVVCDEWLTFSNFKKDIENMIGYQMLINEGWVLDKDILSKDKIYSKHSCCIVPNEINCVFGNKNKITNNTGLPQGVHYHKRNKKYIASCCLGNSYSEYIGSYDSAEDASIAYVKKKIERVNSLAKKYKGLIDDKVYEALINYEISIDD